MKTDPVHFRALIAQALASVEAATTSISTGDFDAILDDLLAARLLLTTLLETVDAPKCGPLVG